MNKRSPLYIMLFVSLLFFGTSILLAQVTWLDSISKVLPTDTYGRGYGVLMGYMQSVYTPACSNCVKYWVDTYATTSSSGTILLTPAYHVKVYSHQRALNPIDPYNKCKSEKDAGCIVDKNNPNQFPRCFFSGNVYVSKDYNLNNPDVYHIAKNIADYSYVTGFDAAKAKIFTRNPSSNGNGTIERNAYWFRGKRSKTDPKICGGNGFMPLFPDDDD
jgi:hypothetical protein